MAPPPISTALKTLKMREINTICTYECRDCAHLTNVRPEELKNDNVMGGCFVDGHITFTDTIACRKIEKRNGTEETDIS